MKKGWKIKKLGVLCPIASRAPQAFVGERCYFATGAVGPEGQLSEPQLVTFTTRPSRAGCMPKVGDIGFARMKGTKKIILVDDSIEGSLFSTGFCFLAPPPTIFPKYLFYFIASDNFQIQKEEAAGEGIMGGIKNTDVACIEFSYPSFSEQLRIVGILDKVFEEIAIASDNVKKNIQNTNNLFKSCIESAITGKLTQDWRHLHLSTENAYEQLKKALTKRRNQWKGTGKYMEPQSPVSVLPIDIPTSWTWASPEQLSTHIIDCPHSTPKWAESGVICLRTTNFKPGFLDLGSVQFVSSETYKERTVRLGPMPDDVLYSREGGILGIACIIPHGLKACLGQRMMLFRLDANIAIPQYFSRVMNSQLILSEVKHLTGGAASPHLNIRDIRTLSIPLPPIPEQHSIVTKLDTISTETKKLEAIYQKQLTDLGELKKSILQKAFAGELTD
jgi:type I restriction enzyme S subunit